MSKYEWRFAPLAGGQRQGFSDNNKDGFKGKDLISNLTRELCQNSLDMPYNSNDAVKVVFELKEINLKDYEDIFSDYANYLQGSKIYWGNEMNVKQANFIANAEEVLKKDKMPLLVISDYNTTGAWGSYDNKINCPWASLTETDGYSYKPKETSGGSYGIGKNVTFACSALNMVFYHTKAEDTESSFIGVSKLGSTLNEMNEPTQGTGKYLCLDDKYKYGRAIFSTDKNKFRDNFKREDYGTDVIIAAFNQRNDWIKYVTQAVLKNFFIAIYEKKLIVELKEGNEHIIIDNFSINQLFSEYSSEENSDMTETIQLYKAFTEPSNTCKLSISEEDDVEVYCKINADYANRIAHFRINGMLIRNIYKKRIFLQRFAAVVVVRGEELNKLLKATEPPKHDKWDCAYIENDEKTRKLAEKAINCIDKKVHAFIKAQFNVITDDTIDATGVGQYLPDDLNSLTDGGDDIMLPKFEINKMQVCKSKIDSNNKLTKPKTNLPTHPCDTPKTFQNVYFPTLRVVPINIENGEYKVIMKPDKKLENLFLKLFIIGETGNNDSLKLVSFKDKINKIELPIKEGKVGPFLLPSNNVSIFIAKINTNETLKLGIHITEEVNICN